MEIDRAHKFVPGGTLEPDSSDEESEADRYRVEIIPTTVGDNKDVSSSVSADRRRMFAKSKSVKNCCSMPVPKDSPPDLATENISRERRRSMPPNMRMPIIKVTPSSPSPDPNHPDYPEFFEDKLYLEHVTRQHSDVTPRPEAEPQVSFDS